MIHIHATLNEGKLKQIFFKVETPPPSWTVSKTRLAELISDLWANNGIFLIVTTSSMDIKDCKSLLNADQIFKIPHQNSE